MSGEIFEKKPQLLKNWKFIKSLRLYRITNIVMDQVHALRIRSFVNFLKNNSNSGAYVRIEENFKSSISKFREKNTPINKVAAEKLEKENWLSEQEANRAKDHDTDLKSMTKDEFNCLVLHGYETAKWNVELFWDNIQTSISG